MWIIIALVNNVFSCLQVERVFITDAQGDLSPKVRLGPYESPEIPDVFLISRA